ncbi:STAS domain-containing protein [Pseudonocardia sp. CA-107938]|uniref:STAS domain-containing protein n=1 Tax=Pseudonocardia sp. CA-107938 TaxID=3240021 RepID=UPI003D8AFE83
MVLDSSRSWFAVTPTVGGRAAVLTFRGVIDLATERAAVEAVQDAVSALPPPDVVVVDLTPVSHFSVKGIYLLRAVADTCARRGLRLRVVVDPDSITAVALRIGGPTDVPIFDTVEAATRAD